MPNDESNLVWADFEPRPGQRVAVYPVYDKLAHLRAWQRVGAFQEQVARSTTRLELLYALDDMTAALAVLVADWDLKDADGNPLPKPAGNPRAFDDLSTGPEGEISWLIGLLGRHL